MSDTKTNLATAIQYHQDGKLREAEALYRDVLREQPDNSVALGNLGIMANQLGKFSKAVELLNESLAINPAHAATHNHLGNALVGLKRVDDAIASYRRAVYFMPDFPEALYNLGAELGQLGRSEESIDALGKVIRLRPNHADAYNALGTAFNHQGKTALAIQALQKAVSLKPGFALAHNNLGNTLLGAGLLERAVESYREALRLKPDFPEALFNMGNALGDLKQLQESIDMFRAVLVLKPDLAEARFNLTKALQNACDWRDERSDPKDFLSYLHAYPGRVDPFFILSQDSSAADQLFCARHFSQRAAVPQAKIFRHSPAKAERKIRIAYISGNFHRHPNSYLSVGMFEHHDRDRFEVYGYSYGPDDGSEIRKRVEKSFDRFTDIRLLTHENAAKKIHEDNIDILIDRQGFTTRHRMGILAYKPAPIQVNYLGYPGTMGAECLDYVIADRFVVPMDQQPFFVERIVHLPGCYQSTDSRQDIATHTPSRSECGLPEDAFVFCCFNNTNKLRAQFFDLWMRLLHHVPGSVLWLLNKNTLVKDNLRREAAMRGIDPDRLVFAPPVKHDEHLARQRCADLFLDTLPYNAHTTASDALWAGLPILTCMGDTFAGRVAASILHAIELPELITHSLAEYEALAVKLANDPTLLAGIRQRVQQNRLTTSLFDTARYTRDIEAAYLRMWDIWQQGMQPQPIVLS